MTYIGCKSMWAWHHQGPKPNIEPLMESLAGHDEWCAEACFAKFMATEAEPDCLHGDPLAEAVFNDLDHDDQAEFKEHKDAIHKQNIAIGLVLCILSPAYVLLRVQTS